MSASAVQVFFVYPLWNSRLKSRIVRWDTLAVSRNEPSEIKTTIKRTNGIATWFSRRRCLTRTFLRRSRTSAFCVKYRQSNAVMSPLDSRSPRINCKKITINPIVPRMARDFNHWILDLGLSRSVSITSRTRIRYEMTIDELKLRLVASPSDARPCVRYLASSIVARGAASQEKKSAMASKPKKGSSVSVGFC